MGLDRLSFALAAGDAQSCGLRRKLAQLAPLAVQHPGAVAQLIEDIEAHHEADKRWQANQKLGKMVEDLIQKQLKSHLSLLRIRLKTQFKGYDLGAYVDDRSYADVGSIKVQQSEALLAKIETKATRGKAVSMSNPVRGFSSLVVAAPRCHRTRAAGGSSGFPIVHRVTSGPVRESRHAQAPFYFARHPLTARASEPSIGGRLDAPHRRSVRM